MFQHKGMHELFLILSCQIQKNKELNLDVKLAKHHFQIIKKLSFLRLSNLRKEATQFKRKKSQQQHKNVKHSMFTNEKRLTLVA